MTTEYPPSSERFPVPVRSELFRGCDVVLFNKFRHYHYRNPVTFGWFIFYLQQLVDAGHTRGSVWLIINRMRWDAIIARDEEFEFAISNDFNTMYGRLAVHHFPQFEGFFSLKAFKTHRSWSDRDRVEYGIQWERRFARECGELLDLYIQQETP